MKWGVAAVCAYEVAAIVGGRTPTVTMLCARHRWLGPLVLITLAAHLYKQPRPPRADRPCLLCLEGDAP